jgi:hypothetical protein
MSNIAVDIKADTLDRYLLRKNVQSSRLVGAGIDGCVKENNVKRHRQLRTVESHE